MSSHYQERTGREMREVGGLRTTEDVQRYVSGRHTPTHITETVDEVEVLSVESAESTVEDRLRVVEEGPEGWRPGMPMPWHMRAPVYDKPLPTPTPSPGPKAMMGGSRPGGSPRSQTPSPVPSPSGRRERGPEPVRVLFPQDEAEDYEVEQQQQQRPEPQQKRLGSPMAGAWTNRPEPMSHYRTPSPLPPTSSSQKAPPVSTSERRRLLKRLQSVDKADEQARGPTPLGFAQELDEASSLPYRFTKLTTTRPTGSPSPTLEAPIPHASPVQERRSPVRQLSPFSFAELLAGLPSAEAIRPETQPQRVRKTEVSPTTQLIDEAERGESHRVQASDLPEGRQQRQQKWEHGLGAEFYSDGEEEEEEEKEDGHKRMRMPRKGRKDDWQVQRQYPVDQFFVPQLFDEPSLEAQNKDKRTAMPTSTTRAPAVQVHKAKRRARPIARKRTKLPSRVKDRPGQPARHYRRGNKDDWQAQRQFPVDQFFEPGLFDEAVGQLAGKEPKEVTGKSAMASREGGGQTRRLKDRKKGHHHHHHHLKGRKDDWMVQRQYPVDYYFTPSLFDEPEASVKGKDEGEEEAGSADWWFMHYREDWQVHRQFSPEHFFEASLFAEPGISGVQAKQPKPSPPVSNELSDLSYSEAVWGRYRASPGERIAEDELHRLDDEERREGIGAWLSRSPVRYDWDMEYGDTWRPGQEVKDEEEELEGQHRYSPESERKGVESKPEEQREGLLEEEETQAKRQHTPALSSPHIAAKKARQDGASPGQPPTTPNYELWDRLISTGPAAVDLDRAAEEAISIECGGLPSDLRAGVWLSLLGVPMVSALCDAYPDLLENAQDQVSESSKSTINWDVSRAVDDPEEQESLQNILQAYCVYDPVVGYAPGMLHTAMLLRTELTEEQTFAGLVRIYFAWDQRRLVVPGVDGLRECLFVLDELLEEHLPDLRDHLGKNGISLDLFAAAWFHALHVHEALDVDLLTWFLLAGRSIMFSTALGLLALNDIRLRQSDDPQQMAFILQHDLLTADVEPRLALDFCWNYFGMPTIKVEGLIRQFSGHRADSIAAWDDQELQLVREEAERVMAALGRLSARIGSVLGDRNRLVGSGQSGRAELAALHRLCYEQAYRLHMDDSRIIEGQFWASAALDESEEEEERGVEEEEERTDDRAIQESSERENDRIADELVQTKMKYAEAQAELDELRGELAANQRRYFEP